MNIRTFAFFYRDHTAPDGKLVLNMSLTRSAAEWEPVIAQLRTIGIRRKHAIMIIGRAQQAAQARLDAQEEKRSRMSEAWREAKERMARRGSN